MDVTELEALQTTDEIKVLMYAIKMVLVHHLACMHIVLKALYKQR